MKLIIAVFFILALLFSFGNASGISVKAALLASLKDDVVRAQEESFASLEKGSYLGIPLVDDLELRLRSKAFDPKRLRYSLRIQPRGLGETRAAHHYNGLFSLSYDRKQKVLRNRALRERYIQILDQMEQRELEERNKELTVVYEDIIKVMEKRKYDVDRFDLTRLIDSEDKNTKVHNQLFELKRASFPSRNTIRKSLNTIGPGNFDTTGFVCVDAIIALLERGSFAFDTNNVYLEYRRLQHQVSGARYDLEKAERKQYISILEFSYDDGEMYDEMVRRNEAKEYNLNNAYGIEVGLRIPDLTVARHDLARRKADYLAEKEDYVQVKQDLMDQMEKDKEDLISLIAQYRFLRSRENEVDAISSLKKYLQMNGVDPLVLLTIQESIVKNHIDMTKVKFSILRNYIRVLDVAGELSKPPLRNYLSANREILEP